MTNGNGSNGRAKPRNTGIESFHRLCQRLEADRGKLAEEKPTCQEMAKRYGDQMGMELSPHTLRRAKIACDMAWKAPKARGTDRTTKKGRRRMVNHDICVLAEVMLVLIDELDAKIGMELAGHLIDIADRRRDMEVQR